MNGDPLDELDEQADEIERLRLTDAEREAIERLAIHCADTSCVDTAKTLWGLLKRTSGAR